ncbi:MAG: beta strand repeat-containing protein, partial [Ignavibacteria bacterium]
MKKTFLSVLTTVLLTILFVQSGNAQITVSGSNTKDGTYTSLTNASGAFAALNLVSQVGYTITISITADVATENGANALTGAAGMWVSLTISPSGARTISGSAAALINLNGADNVTIDGLNTGGNSLTISNTNNSSTAGTSTICFINDATSNIVRNCTIKGSSLASAPGGILCFSTTTGTTGNDDNIIEYNNITNAGGNRPYIAIHSIGTTGKLNSGNIIRYNNIYDVLPANSSIYAIYLQTCNTNWTISNNSFYETSTVTPTANVNWSMIYISGTESGSGYTINYNYIGGNAPQCAGTWTKTAGAGAGFSNALTAISFSPSLVGGTVSNIQGNTITNFDWTNAGAGGMIGIYIGCSSSVNIGTTAGNIIGATTGSYLSPAIKIKNSTTGAIFTGITINANDPSTTVNCQNNSIGLITIANTAGLVSNFVGITRGSGTALAIISNNTIGSTSIANSINCSSAGTNGAQTIYGIKNTNWNGTVAISGNTIANMTNGTTHTDEAIAGLINGIYVSYGTYTITGNTIHDLTIANANNKTDFTASVGGISCDPNFTSAAQTISGNTVYNLSNSYAPFAGNVHGIYYNGSATASTVSGNFIYGLSVTGASSTTANIYGIKIATGTATYSNNIISLGGNTQTTLYGIYEPGTSASLYFNTVYIGGTLGSGVTNKSYALYNAAAAGTRNYRNNIFYNERSTTAGSSLHYGMYIVTSGGTLTCDYNDYYVVGTGGKIGYYAADKTSLPIVTGQDAHSFTTDPSFTTLGGTTPQSYQAGAPLTGVTGAGIPTTDYFNRTRSVTTPKMGAFESGVYNYTWTGTTNTNWSTTTNWVGGYVPSTGDNVVIQTGAANMPVTGSDVTYNTLEVQS